MPTLSRNPTGLDQGPEYDLGSLPVGSWFESYCCVDGTLVVRGYVKEVHEWSGGATVVITADGDGNYIGKYEDRTLARIYDLGKMHRWQQHTPVKWLGVDEELRTVLLEEGGDQEQSRGNRGIQEHVEVATQPVSLLPAVDLTQPIEED